MTNSTSVEAFAVAVAAAFGRLDVLVCNAGFWGAWETRVESTPANFKEAFDANCLGVYLASKSFRSLLMGSDGGAKTIVEICSADMHNRGTNGSTAYSISKMAAARLIEYLDVQQPNLITAAVQPGSVKTEMAKLAPKEIYDSMGLSSLCVCSH